MIRLKQIVLLLSLCVCSCVQAEILVLRSGKQVVGTILVQNDDVVVIKTAEGQRFQYPMSEVTSIRAEEILVEETLHKDTTSRTPRPVALRLGVAGGFVHTPKEPVGGACMVDFQVGSRNLANRRIFLGVGVGYMGTFIGRPCHFIPLQAVVSVPLLQGQHAPEIGASLGYSFAPKGQYGGLVSGIQLAWRYQFSSHSALLLGWETRFQQSKRETIETIENQTYKQTVGNIYILSGVRLSLLF